MKNLTSAVPALLLIFRLSSGWSQTTFTSNPPTGATGVSTSNSMVFTFSGAMNTASTMAIFTAQTTSIPVNSSWNAANTVLTCAPNPSWPSSTTITWAVVGQDASSMQVFGFGTFSTGAGTTSGGGSGTNPITTFAVGKLYIDQQTSTGAPVPVATAPYGFNASASLASNQTATAITVTLPAGGSPRALMQAPTLPEDYSFSDYSANQTNFEAMYKEGDHVFNLTGSPTNIQATVNLPTSMAQPNAPHISNFAQAQAVDPTKPFTLDWDAFQGGTTADFISFGVGVGLFMTSAPGYAGALNGTATSVTIPAGTLPANSNLTATVFFYRFVTASNSTYATFAYRATGTQFNLTTTAPGTGGTPPVINNLAWSSKGLGFDVATSANQSLKVLYSSDCSRPIAQWQTVYTTNSPGASLHIDVPQQAGAAAFFRMANGP